MPLTLYQIEVVLVTIIEDDIHPNLYTEIQISKPYTALIDELYISLRHEELRSCKHIGYDFYCEELFIIKCKSKYRCETTVFFDPAKDIIKDSCTFNYCFNNTSIKPVALDGGTENILANWLDKKSLKHTSYNDIPIKIPDYSYVLVIKSILCSCELEVEESFLLDLVVACTDHPSQFKHSLQLNRHLSIILTIGEILLCQLFTLTLLKMNDLCH